MHMAMTKKDIEKLAQLARIELSDAEKEKFSGQISSILEYVKQIEEVDTASVIDTDHHGEVSNVTRADEVRQYKDTKKIIDQFPEKYGNLNKVKKVFE
jgi:aspartyl-tRNA(Asn)/glutamyl-tRNA(Gln) amidotransferase subunit C